MRVTNARRRREVSRERSSVFRLEFALPVDTYDLVVLIVAVGCA
jgi:hypothetical protein